MEERIEHTSPWGGFVDYYNIFKDVSREWLTILIITVCSGVIAYMAVASMYKPVYRTQTTMVVTATGTYNDIYKNVQSASNSAESFSKLLNSSTLRTMVAKEMGQEHFKGTANAEVLSDSNLLVLTVDADDPETAFKEMKGILDHYSVLTYEMMGNIRLTLLDPPKASGTPVNAMNARVLVMKVMVLAFAVTLFLLIMLSALRDTIRNSRDVERKLDTKLLASVHKEEKSKSILARFKKDTRSILITNPVTSFRFVETIRKLASRTANSMRDKHAKSLLLTSVTENEGKSTIVANLALAMAEEGNKVLLIDADFRKPALYKVLNMQEVSFKGLSDYLLHDSTTDQIDEMVETVPGTTLNCILNKNAMPQTMEMLSSSKMRDLIQHVVRQYDFVLIDSSPMQLVADAEELADMVDMSMLVVRQHFVEARQINDGIDSLNSRKKRVIGCVFNYAHSGRFGSVGSFAYGNSSGYGYGYGYGGHYDK